MWTCLAAAIVALPPSAALEQAHADLRTLSVERRLRVRYLSLHNLPASDWDGATRVLSGHVNGLSRAADVTPLLAVAGSGGALLRLDLDDYDWDTRLWERLAEVDPYFHVRIEVVEKRWWEAGIEEGRPYAAGWYDTRVRKTALAPWLAESSAQKAKLAEVVAWMQSRAPLVRGDWFFNQTAAAVDRTPNYYDFLAIKDERDFQKLVGFDARLGARFVELREAVADSGVTLQPRAIARHGTPGGGYWRTFDVRRAVDRANPLRVLGRAIEKDYDASEQYGHLPNGFWATGLFDRAGVRQDTAPDFIASDGASRSNDRRVHVNVSCVRCHAHAGLHDLDGWTRNLFRPPLTLQAPEYRQLRLLRQQYLRRLEPFLERDRQIFAEAVRAATGLDAKEYARRYAAFWERYEDAKVDRAWAARDLGVAPETLRRALERQLKATGQLDPILAALLLEGDRRRSIGIRPWEEVYPLAATILRGGSTP